ncbi:MAG: alpha/beta hydrolase [Rhodovibrionaceae bacterium]
MQLEIIDRQPASAARGGRPPLLFVHGAFVSAWVWDEHFLPYFAAAGYPSYALSQRGHGNSAGREDLATASLLDYSADVAATAQALDAAPVLIGHSMGGAVVQKTLETLSAPAMVLMNSVSPYGLASSNIYLALGNPWLYQRLMLIHGFGPSVVSPEGMDAQLFAQPLPDARGRRYLAGMQRESKRVVWDLLGFDLPRLDPGRLPPALVLGAEADAMLPWSDIAATARAYATEPRRIPKLGHAMMLEKDWRAAAEPLLAWLESRFV